MKELSAEELHVCIVDEFENGLAVAGVVSTIDNWLLRGDGCAVYRNVDLGSRELGHRQFVSFGSATAQLEVDEPPTRLPDIGDAINWRYQLEGVYRGEPLVASA